MESSVERRLPAGPGGDGTPHYQATWFPLDGMQGVPPFNRTAGRSSFGDPPYDLPDETARQRDPRMSEIDRTRRDTRAAPGRTRRPGRLPVRPVLFALALSSLACRAPAPSPPSPPGGNGASGSPGVSASDSAKHGPFFYHGRRYGTDAYAGPLDILFNKGYAVAQWEGKGRDIFDYPYGWGSVKGSLTQPGYLARRFGGWRKVFMRQVVPFAEGGINDSQWVPNYFGHVLEGGIAYRRLREWNEAHGVPLPSLTAFLINWGSAVVNEAYENPYDENLLSKDGNTGTTMDLMLFDPLGIILFHQDVVSRFFARRLYASLWPTQASLTVTDHLLMNNGESIVLKPPVPFTDRVRFFIRAGMGLEGGLSLRRPDGVDVSVALGQQSRQRWLNPYTTLEWAEFGWSAGIWADRDGTLLAGLTWDQGTDRRVALNVYPGFLHVAGADLGAWFVVDAAGRPYLGFTSRRTLGAGLGIGF